VVEEEEGKGFASTEGFMFFLPDGLLSLFSAIMTDNDLL
jgi:hypothetical protein